MARSERDVEKFKNRWSPFITIRASTKMTPRWIRYVGVQVCVIPPKMTNMCQPRSFLTALFSRFCLDKNWKATPTGIRLVLRAPVTVQVQITGIVKIEP